MTSSVPDDLGGMLAGMARIQQELEAAQAGAAAAEAVGSAGGGAVTVRASGEFSFDEVRIDPELVGTADVSVLEDLVLAAIRNAVDQLFERRKRAMGDLMSGGFGALLGGGFDESTPEKH
jgi:DNA-binding YbaB/EbfC family protein